MISKKEKTICPELRPIAHKNKNFYRKTYSIFKDKELIKYLKLNKINKIYLCGLEIDACILASVFDSFDLGYKFDVITNLCSSKDKELVFATKRIIKRNLTKIN
jgi:nicotinamidase-related amidase